MAWCVFLAAAALAGSEPWAVRGPDGEPTGRSLQPEALFQVAEAGWAGERGVLTNRADLAEVAENTAEWLRSGDDCARLAVGLPTGLGLDLSRTLETLDTIARIAREDLSTGQDRLADPAFLESEFELWRWTHDREGAKARGHQLPAAQVRVTRYLVSQIEGRAAPEGAYKHALYADPGPDERLKYSRAEVIAGAWKGGGADPLVWLTEAGVYEAHMQGTVEVRLPDESVRMLNVHQHNDKPYKPGVGSRYQDKYWYFRQVDGAYGFGSTEHCPRPGKVKLAPMAAVAGDVHNLGLGRIVLLEGRGGFYLTVLADTGGAFSPNLFQVDWYGGAFTSHGALYAATKGVPTTTGAALLVVRRPESGAGSAAREGWSVVPHAVGWDGQSLGLQPGGHL